jgi:SulP family sulfate permease
VAVGLVTALTSVLKLPATTLIGIAGAEAFAGGTSVLPSLGIPAIGALTSAPLATLGIVAPYAATIASVGLIESLLTLQLVDGMVDDGRRGSTRAECVGQGLGNFFSGLTGGMGGCALIGQSLINVQSGGTSRLSGVAMATFLAANLVFLAPLLGQVPIAALVGVMLLVCQSTFAWSSLRLWNKVPKVDLFCIGAVSLVTIFADLAQAVGVGTIISALAFAWKQSQQITATRVEGADALRGESPKTDGWRTYKVRGPLFFGSTQGFSNLFDPKNDPAEVVFDFMDSRVMDHSALEAINSLSAKYGELGKRVHLRHLSSDCAALLARLNGELPPYEIVESDPTADPIYEVAEDYRGSTGFSPPVPMNPSLRTMAIE